MEDKTSSAAPTGQPQQFLQWVTPAYRQTEKSKGWYLMMGAIVLIFVLYGLFSDEYGWIVSVTFLILAGAYYLSELKPSPVIQVTINELGMRFGAKFYAYSQIKSFWILNEEGARSLHICPYRGNRKDISAMIPPEVNIARMRDYLLLQISEDEGRKESISDQLIRNLGL